MTEDQATWQLVILGIIAAVLVIQLVLARMGKKNA
jgi:hypothetical protein